MTYEFYWLTTWGPVGDHPLGSHNHTVRVDLSEVVAYRVAEPSDPAPGTELLNVALHFPGGKLEVFLQPHRLPSFLEAWAGSRPSRRDAVKVSEGGRALADAVWNLARTWSQGAASSRERVRQKWPGLGEQLDRLRDVAMTLKFPEQTLKSPGGEAS